MNHSPISYAMRSSLDIFLVLNFEENINTRLIKLKSVKRKNSCVFFYAIEYISSDWSKFSIANADGNIDDDYSLKMGMRLHMEYG